MAHSANDLGAEMAIEYTTEHNYRMLVTRVGQCLSVTGYSFRTSHSPQKKLSCGSRVPHEPFD